MALPEQITPFPSGPVGQPPAPEDPTNLDVQREQRRQKVKRGTPGVVRAIRAMATIGPAAVMSAQVYTLQESLRHKLAIDPSFASRMTHQDYVDMFNKGDYPYFLMATAVGLVLSSDIPIPAKAKIALTIGALGLLAGASWAVENVTLPYGLGGTKDPTDKQFADLAIEHGLLLRAAAYPAAYLAAKGIELAREKVIPGIRERVKARRAKKRAEREAQKPTDQQQTQPVPAVVLSFPTPDDGGPRPPSPSAPRMPIPDQAA